VRKLQARYADLHIIYGKKEGLGNAYLRGFSYALEAQNPSVVFEMDADWSHNPSQIPGFLKKIEEGVDFVIGSRYMKGGSIPKNWGLHRKLFSIIGNLIIRFGFMVRNIRDWTSGYRAIRTWYIKEILGEMENYNGYVFQVALLDRAHKRGLRIAEIPIHFKDRKKGVSKIKSMQYIITTLWYVFLHSSFIKFVIVGTIGFLIDFTLSFLFIEKIKLSIWISTVISSEVAIISNFFCNNFWSFSHKKVTHAFLSYIKKFSHFNLVAVGSIIIQAILLHFATVIFPAYLWYIYKTIIIIAIIIPYSYYMYNYVIWKKKSRT